ncbi:hypothetical protein S40288_09841 [Stachybotrys chartarum IBT 40288]|nr:hypothetical protein S40288_09841 [Stachybotrys chartarum IBT 40288]
MAQPDQASEPPPRTSALSPLGKSKFLRLLFGSHQQESISSPPQTHAFPDEIEKGELHMNPDDPIQIGSRHRTNRKVITGLPRTQTFKRQQSEQRVHLTPVETDQYERRAVSVDRRSCGPLLPATFQDYSNPRASAPGHIHTSSQTVPGPEYAPSLTASTTEDASLPEGLSLHRAPTGGDGRVDEMSVADAQSMTTSQYEAMIHRELESTWILNLSMHFRDKSKREKFFVTYREHGHLWRRVTISLDYRNATPNSLEGDLAQTEFQRDKSAKIYEAIRESLPEIQFYDTVTNLKLQTVDGRLIVHVVEDGNEIISYPRVHQIKYLGCRRIRERDIDFESHMSGFVYKVNVNGKVLIKKEIPSPETIDEFLYEINALNSLRFSNHVVKFHGVVVDDHDEFVKGLLISYAEQGALIDIIYDNCKDRGTGLPWSLRERWARQIVQGLADIHESGFVQGDFTLSNIVIDDLGDAKIIDINRRGCPVGWEPPEATALIESNQRISMYIGVKSDLYQLGMVLWGLAMEEDEPEREGRPLVLGPEVQIPDWYRRMTEDCLNFDPRARPQASSLIERFPAVNGGRIFQEERNPISVDDGHVLHDYIVEGYGADGRPYIREIEPTTEWPSYMTRRYLDPSPSGHGPYTYTRGRSPPSPLPSNCGDDYDLRGRTGRTGWAANINIAPSYSDVGAEDVFPGAEAYRQPTPTPTVEKGPPTFSLEPARPDTLVDVGSAEQVPAEAARDKAQEATVEGHSSQAAQGIVEDTSEAVSSDAIALTPDSTKSLETTVPSSSALAENTLVNVESDEDSAGIVAKNLSAGPPAETTALRAENADQGEEACDETIQHNASGVEENITMPEKGEAEGQGAQEEMETGARDGEDNASSGKTEPDTAAETRAAELLERDKDAGIAHGDASTAGEPVAPSEQITPTENDYIQKPQAADACYEAQAHTTDATNVAELRTTEVPDALVGVGSVHFTTESQPTREEALADDDFDDTIQLDAAPMTTVTADGPA